MKKLIFVFMALVGVAAVNAQDFNLGVNAGLPIGDAGDSYTFSAVLDLSYLWEVSESFKAGVASGVSHSFGDSVDLGPLGTVDVEDATFLPIAAAGRFNVSDDFTLGADLGYGIGLAPDGNDGGFYYAPRAQYSVSDAIDIVLAYRGTSIDGGSFDILTLGVEFGL